ncbi:MAG TPA: DUF3352 domain-containing protein [Solirubrobacterales bacterium]|nr:DUF3352 domain-containing protein [Solirubrobacterales bacterium]
MTRTPFALLVLAATAAVAGCGGDGGSSSDAAGFAAPGSLVFVEAELRPTGEMKADVDEIAGTVAGADSLGDLIVSELESSASEEGEPVDFAKEVEPWLGEKAGVAFQELDEDGDPSDPVIAVETTDATATQEFIDDQAAQSSDSFEDGSYEGIDFKVGGSDDNGVGVIDDFLVIAEGKKGFKAAVDAVGGDSLADEARFADAISAASDGSFADIYVDVGGLLEASDDEIDPQAREILESSGIDPSEATAVASVIPGSGQIQVDVSSDLGGEEAPSGDASELIGSLPADSFAAVGATEFGDQLTEAIDELDKTGIPDQGVPPNQLKNTLKEAGVDLDEIAESLEDAAVFARGSSESSLAGALVLTSDSGEAAKAVANLGDLLRDVGTPGVTAVSSNGASGFSVRSSELGDKPLVVVSKGHRVAIGYSLAPALDGLDAESGSTLSGQASYEAAVSALGGTPISAFADGPGALRLAESMIKPSDDDFEDFQEAKPYLRHVEYVGMGSGSDGDLATAKLIVGLEE